MRLLLDTHTVLWWLAGDERLSDRAADAISAAEADSLVSAASIWEASIKQSAGKLVGPDLFTATTGSGFPVLAMTGEHARLAGQLPLHHRDPFDRMLVAQASLDGLVLVSRDEGLRTYGIPVLW
ncbi:type II toxin-antitoxin system VapC family toxin [soil metagenome]